MDSLVCLAAPCSDGSLAPLDLVRLGVTAFTAILFLQSGVDKIVDRKGNVDWLTGHFSKSPLASVVIPMLGILTLVELATGVIAALGVPMLLVGGSRSLASLGMLLSVVALLMLFFGQRMAKDYAGAAGLVPYFVVACAGLAVMGLP